MRPLSLFFILLLIVILPSFFYLKSSIHTREQITPLPEFNHDVITGPVVMPQLGNATIKAELGRSSWKLLHTMMGRFPEQPTTDEKEALKSFIYLFSRLYPCGECATEFQSILEKYPPQVSSRVAASQWACAVHNIVNQRLQKEIFDCGTVAEKYKCGCDDEDITA